MGIEKGSRCGATEGKRLRSFRLTLGSVAFELLRDGQVRVASPTVGVFRDLRAFLAAMRASKGGA